MTNSPHQATLHAGDALLAALERIAAALEAQNAIAEAQIQRAEERRAASLAAAEADRARAVDYEAVARDALERVTRAAEAIQRPPICRTCQTRPCPLPTGPDRCEGYRAVSWRTDGTDAAAECEARRRDGREAERTGGETRDCTSCKHYYRLDAVRRPCSACDHLSHWVRA